MMDLYFQLNSIPLGAHSKQNQLKYSLSLERTFCAVKITNILVKLLSIFKCKSYKN
jgi:hypothetical protein